VWQAQFLLAGMGVNGPDIYIYFFFFFAAAALPPAAGRPRGAGPRAGAGLRALKGATFAAAPFLVLISHLKTKLPTI